MRTTLDLDPDVLQAAKEIAAARGTTAGKVISDLVRKALEPRGTRRRSQWRPVDATPARRVAAVTVKLVEDLLDEP